MDDMRNRETMTSRQRVMATVNHDVPDRMPIDLGMHYASGISAFAYHDLREYLGLSTEHIVVPEMNQVMGKVDDDILRMFHIDCTLLTPGFRTTKRWNPRGKYHFIIPGNANPVLNEKGDWIIERNGSMRMPEGGYFFDGDWMSFEDRDRAEQLEITAREAERIYKDTDYYTTFLQYGAFFNGSDVEFLCRLITDPESIERENEAILNYIIEDLGNVFDKIGQYAQAIQLASDLGAQNGPLCSPTLFDELCLPYLARLCKFIHENSDMKVNMHSCGSIRPFIPSLIEAGIDILNPVQISARDMDPYDLKRDFGDRITFWGGGCNTQGILDSGTPGEVRENVRELIKAFKPNGGYVFNQVQNVMGNVKPENIVAMLETAYEESFY